MNVNVKQQSENFSYAACLSSILKHYDQNVPVESVCQFMPLGEQGMCTSDLVKVAESVGLVAKEVMCKEDSLPQIPYPAIAFVKYVDGGVEQIRYVVVFGCKKSIMQIMDPKTGQLESQPKDVFCNNWTGKLFIIDAIDRLTIKGTMWKRFVDLAKPHRKAFLLAFIGAAIFSVLGLSMSIYIEKVTDNVLVDGNVGLLNVLSIIMIVILVLQFSIGIFQNIIAARSSILMDARLVMGYYRHLLNLPQSFFDTNNVGEIISRVNDANCIQDFINSTVINIIVNALIVILSFVLMFCYYWKLAALMFAVIPIYAIIYFIADKLNQKIERSVMEDTASVESQLFESLDGVKTIKQFGIEEYANRKTEKCFVKLLYSVYDSIKTSVFSDLSSDFVSRLFTVILIWSGCYFVVGGDMTIGEVMSFYTLVGYFTAPVSSLITANQSVREAVVAADRLYEYMDVDRGEDVGNVTLSHDSVGDIVFENVEFTYSSGRQIFTDFNIRFSKSKMSAIVGESGSGKTTLINLLQNLYPISSGKILIGDTPLNQLSNKSLRSVVSVVPQQVTLFSGNVVENIALGELEPDVERIEGIVKQLGLVDFIKNLPDGYETQIGEDGAMLSGGQKQRLAIARVLYKNPEIIIFDEATSSLDSISEKYVHDTLQELRNQGKTIIVIAHRLSTIRWADEIFVLENGKLVEQGNFSDLMALNGKFSDLWNLQMM